MIKLSKCKKKILQNLTAIILKLQKVKNVFLEGVRGVKTEEVIKGYKYFFN